MGTEYQVHGDVAVITLANPPVNGLGRLTARAWWAIWNVLDKEAT